MDTDILDASYYAGKFAAPETNLDVPLSNGEIVTINLDEELPEDLMELVSFLQTERCPVRLWLTVAQAYCWHGARAEAAKLVTAAMQALLSDTSDNAPVQLHGFVSWLYLHCAANPGADVAAVITEGTRAQHDADAEVRVQPDAHTPTRTRLLQLASDSIGIVSRLDPANVPNLLAKAVLGLARDDSQRHDTEKAVETFDQLLKIDATNCFALLGKAQVVLRRTHNYAAALKLYQQVLMLNPVMQPDPRIGIGLCFWLLRDERMAVALWERSVEIDPRRNVKLKILLALARMNLAFTKLVSDDAFVEAYLRSMQEVAALQRERPSDGVLLMLLVSWFYAKREYEMVTRICDRVEAIVLGGEEGLPSVGGGPATANLLSQASLWRGRVAFAEADFMRAQKHFHEAIKRSDANLMAKLGLGQAQMCRGSLEEAIITFESVHKTDPKCVEVNYALGMLYTKQRGRRKQEAAVQMLERYVRLAGTSGSHSGTGSGDGAITGEPVILNALLTLSKLYEPRDLNQALAYLNRAIELRKLIGQDAPLEVYNNIGVMHYLKHNTDSAAQFLQNALSKLETLPAELAAEISVTLRFNLARVKEATAALEAEQLYRDLVAERPDYYAARLRLVFLRCIEAGSGKGNVELSTVYEQLEELLKEQPADLEVRLLYGWFCSRFGRAVGLKPDVDTKHHKDTLVEYDLHDCYALLSLANIYSAMARDTKEGDKRRKYYTRLVELFAKVLLVDSHDVYAAQGLAIVYIANKDALKGLDVLRKIRDSLNDVLVYVNLAHVLLDTKQYSKAIENYEIALHRFGEGEGVAARTRLLSLLGRAWYLRGVSEGNLTFLRKALEHLEEAIALSLPADESTAAPASLRFNLAYVQFQIADYVSKLPVDQRTAEDIRTAILGLNDAISTLNDLASDEEPHAPFPKSDIKARANLGSQTLLNRLTVCLEETEEHLTKFEHRLEEAQREREREEQAMLREEEERRAKQKAIEDELAKERAKLQEQAQQWAEENRLNTVEARIDDEDFEETEGKPKGKKRQPAKKGAKKGGRKRKAVVSDEESATDKEPTEPEALDSAASDPEDVAADEAPKGGAKKRARGKRIDDDEEEDQEVASRKKKRLALSSERIVDSDDDLGDVEGDAN
jgi:RNA polymerase-associated protein CTR9